MHVPYTVINVFCCLLILQCYFFIRNYLLNKWKSQNIGARYVEFFEQLQEIGSSIVQSAYDTWLELCHMPLSSKPDLATLNEVYEVFVAMESDVLQSFERVGIATFVKTIKKHMQPTEAYFT